MKKGLKIKPEIPKIVRSIFILGFIAFWGVFNTGAYFVSQAKITNNIFETGYWPEPEPGRVVINEVYYDVASDRGGDPENEWVELYNAGANSVNLKDWTIEDNYQTRTLTASDLEIQPGGFVLISKTNLTWDYWSISPLIPPPGVKFIELGTNIGSGLRNLGDRLTLKDNLGNTIDAISWGDDITILDPSIPSSGKGNSLERSPKGQDTGLAADFIIQTAPSPGTGL